MMAKAITYIEAKFPTATIQDVKRGDDWCTVQFKTNAKYIAVFHGAECMGIFDDSQDVEGGE